MYSVNIYLLLKYILLRNFVLRKEKTPREQKFKKHMLRRRVLSKQVNGSYLCLENSTVILRPKFTVDGEYPGKDPSRPFCHLLVFARQVSATLTFATVAIRCCICK